MTGRASSSTASTGATRCRSASSPPAAGTSSPTPRAWSASRPASARGIQQIADVVGPDATAVAVLHGGVIAEACRQVTRSEASPRSASASAIARRSACRPSRRRPARPSAAPSSLRRPRIRPTRLAATGPPRCGCARPHRIGDPRRPTARGDRALRERGSRLGSNRHFGARAHDLPQMLLRCLEEHRRHLASGQLGQDLPFAPARRGTRQGLGATARSPPVARRVWPRPSRPTGASTGSSSRRTTPRHCVHVRRRLLDRDGSAGFLEGGLGLLGLLPVDLAVKHGLRRAIDEVLGLLEAEAGRPADDLDDLDLLGAGRLEDDVELVLLLGPGCASAWVGGVMTGGGASRTGRVSERVPIRRRSLSKWLPLMRNP